MHYQSAGLDTHYVIVNALHHAHTTLLNLGFTQEKLGSPVWPVIKYTHNDYGAYVFEGAISAERDKYVCREIEIGYIDAEHINDMAAHVLDLVNIKTMSEHLSKLVKRVADDNLLNGETHRCSTAFITRSLTPPTS
jgi:hypothetical protein